MWLGRSSKPAGVALMIAILTLAASRLRIVIAMPSDDIPRPDGLSSSLLQTGTVSVLGYVACPPGAAKAATCRSIRVSCAGLTDLDATLAVAVPGGNPSGTIVMLDGGSGTAFLNSGFPDIYVADRFQVVQLAWHSNWADAGGAGVKSAACRPATVLQFVYNVVQGGSPATGFCGQGISGGGAAFAYSLTHYGMSNLLDYVAIAAGPGVARMDYGCDPALYTGPPRNLCPLLPSAPFAYRNGTLVNTWEKTTACATPNPAPSDIQRWTADSIVSAGANYTYPNTALSWFFCVTPQSLNESTGQGTFFIEQAIPKNSPPDVNCYSGKCQAEAVWTDPSAFNITLSEMLAQCKPNHQGLQQAVNPLGELNGGHGEE